MRTVVLSFTSALDCMAAGTLSEDDLKDAIFALGCGRSFPLETGAEEILKIQAPHQKRKVTLGHIMKFTKYLEEAERNKRVVWRRHLNGDDISPSLVQTQLSSVLQAHNLEALNPNLPPVGENIFLKTAIERVNNKNGTQRVQVVV